jgi:hypothetical protein
MPVYDCMHVSMSSLRELEVTVFEKLLSVCG